MYVVKKAGFKERLESMTADDRALSNLYFAMDAVYHGQSVACQMHGHHARFGAYRFAEAMKYLASLEDAGKIDRVEREDGWDLRMVSIQKLWAVNKKSLLGALQTAIAGLRMKRDADTPLCDPDTRVLEQLAYEVCTARDSIAERFAKARLSEYLRSIGRIVVE